MRAMLCILALVPSILAQDDVQVDCTPDHMEIRVTKGKSQSRTFGFVRCGPDTLIHPCERPSLYICPHFMK